MKPHPLIALLIVILLCQPVSVSQMDSEDSTNLQVSVPGDNSIVFASDIAEEVYHQASETLFLDIIKDLTSFGPRPYLSETNIIVREWLISKLTNVSNNRLEIETKGTAESIVARLPGTLNISLCFIVGGHYDTVEGSPGANDDGTGVATTIELARILSQYVWPIDIYFCLWNAEEIGLVGSGEIAGQFFSDEIDILCYYNIDMLLVQDDNAPVDERVLLYYTSDYETSTRSTHFTIYQDSQYWAELVQSMNANYGLQIIKPYPHRSTTTWYYSDHYPFFAAGYKSAMFFFESGFGYDDAYHSAQDTWDNPLYDYSLTKPVVASIGASIAHAQSRTYGQKYAERYSLLLGARTSQEIKFQSSIATDIALNATTPTGNTLRFEALNPMRALLAGNTPGIANMDHRNVLTFTTEAQGQHSIIVRNLGVAVVEVEIEFSYESDLEGDMIPDSTQEWYNRFKVDSDLDTINDAYEMQRNLNRFDHDSDHDSIPDNEEIFIHGTLPYSSDSDLDMLPDNWEILYGLNPTNRQDKLEDPDQDLLNNIGEYRAGTNPRINDSDFDSILDGLEVWEYQTSPLSNDSDSDSLPDNWEIEFGLNPLVDDAAEDKDGDGKSNLEEYLLGENPNEKITTTIMTTANIVLFPPIILGTSVILAVIIISGIILKQRHN